MEPSANLTAAEKRVGTLLHGKWRLEKLLGVGGMASVYAGTHRNGQRGAVKVLHPELSANDDARTRFLREGYAANRVDHPGCVRVLDDDITGDGSVFLVMELLDGVSVQELQDRAPNHRLPLADVLSIADQLLDVLAAAHDKGVVHRDLKPDNLFVTRGGTLKVLDFGIAKLREVAAGPTATAAGVAMGTPAFMPPEQAFGYWHEVDAQSDLWAVGAVLWTLLSGTDVHAGTTMQEVLLSAMTRSVPPLATIAPEYPEVVCRLVDRALAFRKADRPANAREMQREVRAALELRAPRRTLPPVPPPRALLPSVPVAEAPVRGGRLPTTAPLAFDRDELVAARASTSRRMIAALVGASLLLGGMALIGVLALQDPPAGLETPSAAFSPDADHIVESAWAPPPSAAPPMPNLEEPTEPPPNEAAPSAKPRAHAEPAPRAAPKDRRAPSPEPPKSSKPRDPMDRRQ